MTDGRRTEILVSNIGFPYFYIVMNTTNAGAAKTVGRGQGGGGAWTKRLKAKNPQQMLEVGLHK